MRVNIYIITFVNDDFFLSVQNLFPLLLLTKALSFAILALLFSCRVVFVAIQQLCLGKLRIALWQKSHERIIRVAFPWKPPGD